MTEEKIKQLFTKKGSLNHFKSASRVVLGVWQRLVLRVNGSVFLRYEKRKGWSGYLPIFLVKCALHGYFEDYQHGYDEHFECPLCREEAVRNG